MISLLFRRNWRKGVVMETNAKDRYINLDEVAEYLGVKPITIRSWIKNPKTEIPARKIGRAWKFKISEIEEWVKSGKSAINNVND